MKAQRQKTTAAVFTRADSFEELTDGYRLTYPNTALWRERLEQFQADWQESCPHMSFELISEGVGGKRQLEIRGPEGTKKWVLGSRHMLESHLIRAPTHRNRALSAWRLLSSPLRMKPDFLILGAMKCGTTSLYTYLIEHPSIKRAFQKEIHYFDALHARGSLWYRSFFPSILEKALSEKVLRRPLLTGEATPSYLYHSHVAPRVAKDLPHARFFALLRNPVDRAYSFYNHNRRVGIETLPFEEAIDREPERMELEPEQARRSKDGFGFYRNNFSYLARGMYADQLAAWREHIPEERLLVFTTEDLNDRPERVLRQALEFLGLPYVAPPEFRRMNAAPYPAMEAATRRRLEEMMRPHNQRLYELLGRNLGW